MKINSMFDRKEKIETVLVLAGIAIFTGFVGCPIKTMTGIPCPACGMTRAWIHMLTGDLYGALTFHPLFFTAPWIVWLIIEESMGKLQKRKIHLQMCIIVMAYLLLWVIRIWLFPRGPVYVEYSKGWIEKAVQYFINLRGNICEN